jgi:hypothetical protein
MDELHSTSCAERFSIIKQAAAGEMTPEEAEAWAESKHQPPLASKPDSALFDPMSEPFWSLPMAVAWIMWRTSDAVREYWDDYRCDCYVWKENRGADGHIAKGWHIERLGPSSIPIVRRDASKQDPEQVTIDANGAIADLWRRQRAGKMIANGISYSP